MNITIKNIRPEVHERLREAAKRNGRSLNRQILMTLERSVCPAPIERKELLERVRHRRGRMTVVLDDALLESARREGRA